MRPIQPALVTRVLPDSIAEDLGFEPGDRLVSINGERPRDLIDYRFLCADELLTLEVLDSANERHEVELEKDLDDDLGLEFETALFDGLIQCNNRCPFCFIDQQPPGKRKTLYLKDDDYRLSFLYGSYLTLTNLTQPEWERIAQLRLSPLYVSVHATDPDVRSRLLKNPRAGQILDQLRWFRQHRLQIHAQVVVCPGINDGEQLTRTLMDLAQFYDPEEPTVLSAAVVPVGLTRFRPDIDELTPVDTATAREVIARVQPLQAQLLEQHGSRFVWLADEWFLIGRLDLPPAEHYESYPQIGNGVGSIHQFLDQFHQAAADLPQALPLGSDRRLSWVVGNAVEYAFAPLVQRLNQVSGLTVSLAPLRSRYWGQDITVTGLLTGQDLLSLTGQDLGDGLLLPSLMLKHDEAKFLDDMTVDEVAEALQTPIHVVNGVDALIQTCLTPGYPSPVGAAR